MAFLIDTNVISELRKGPRCEPAVRTWQQTELASQTAYLSVVTVGEIRKGIDLIARRDKAQAAMLETWLSQLCLNYATRILPITLAVAEDWGKLNASRPLPAIDSLLAATARTYGFALATRNTGDLQGIGLALVNPFAYGTDSYTV